jgi:hypothetical protein
MLALLAQQSSDKLIAAILFTMVSMPTGMFIGYLAGWRYKRRYLMVARELAALKGQNFRNELTTITSARPAKSGSTLPPLKDMPPTATGDQEERGGPTSTAPTRESTNDAAGGGEPANEQPTDAVVSMPTELLADENLAVATLEQQLAEVEQELEQEIAQHHAAQESWESERQSLEAELEAVKDQLQRTEAARQTAETRLSQLQDERLSLQNELEAARAATADPPILSPPHVADSSTEAWQIAQLHREQIAMQLRMDELLDEILSLRQQRDELRAQLEVQ